MNISRKYLGDAFTILVLVLATGAFQSLLLDTSTAATTQTVSEGNSLLQVVWALVYLVVLIRAIQNFGRIAAAIRANKFLIALVLLAVVSVFWSEEPGLTLRRGVALLGTTLFGLDFAVRYPIRKQLQLVAIALSAIVALSVIVQVFFAGLIPVVDKAYPNAWVGLFDQKNVFARVIVLTAIVVLTSVRRSMNGILTAIFTFVAAVGLIILTQSITAVVALVGLILVLQFAPALRWTGRVRTLIKFCAATMVVPAIFLLIHYWGLITYMLGRNATLTGRAQLWAVSLSSIELKPLLGYGYSAFWMVSQEALRINAMLRWTVPHAHNAYLDLALEVGLIGLALYVVAYIVALWRAVGYMRADSEPGSKWPLVYLSFILLYSFTESSVLVPGSIFWMLFVAAACTASQPVGALAFEPAAEGAHETDPGSDPGPSFATS
jgi:exopolysaccharide production protein ExoQ